MRGALCLGLLAGCGDARAVSDGASSVTSAQTSISVSEATPTTGAPILDLGAGGCGLGNGDLGLSFIWIANSTQGTISKIDTRELRERGRYIVRPDAAGDPSRTSVNLAGDVAVANRNGGITKVYALPERCVESNGEPGLQTATDAEFLAWGVEECVAWHTPLAYRSQRPVAWTAGDFDAQRCRWTGQKLWTAGMNTAGTVDILRLDGDTGAVEAMTTIAGVHADIYGMYGGAVDAGGNFWASQVGHGSLLFVDAVTLEHKMWDLPVGAYGITVDADGNVWTCAGNATRFDPETESFTVTPAGEYGGCMLDGAGLLYKATPGGILAFDTASLTIVRTYPLPRHIHGISVDFDGYVWGVSQGSEAYRLDPVDGSFATVAGLIGAYTYSDMTGFALSQVAVP